MKKEDKIEHILGFIYITIIMSFFVLLIVMWNGIQLHSSYKDMHNIIDKDKENDKYIAEEKAHKHSSNIIGKIIEEDKYYLLIEENNGDISKREIVKVHYDRYIFE